MIAHLKIYVDPSVEESIPDRLSSDFLQITAGPAKYVKPGRQTTVKLTVKNFSSVGRMALISAQFDGGKLSVDIPMKNVYIAPQGTTAIHALVRTYASVGPADITFSIT